METCKFRRPRYPASIVGNIPTTRPRKTPAQKPGTAGEPPRLLALIEAAEDVFLSKGYHDATMSDVAKAAGMSKKTVYTLIESKSELFAALLSHHHSRLSFPVPEPGWSTAEILCANLLCLARFLLAPEQIAILRLIMAEHAHSPDLSRVFLRSRVKKAKSKLEICIAELAEKHGISSVDAKELSSMLFGMAIGEFHFGVLVGFRPMPSRATLEKRVRRAVDIFLAGCWTGCASLCKQKEAK